MIWTCLAAVACALAAVPALVFLANLRHYRPCPRPPGDGPPVSVSVLIPARNEERSLGAVLEAVLAGRDVDLEVIVVDDHSEDDTGRIAAKFAASDVRLRLLGAPPLPPGWCGKPYAGTVAASAATKPLLVFMDADVLLEPDSLARMAAFLKSSGADLASGVPRQQTGTLAERLVIPLVHFILLGFLPVGRMRERSHPSYAAGCGQLFICARGAYEAMGGHGAIRDTLHDGLKLPRAFRAAGLKTDLFDATDIARCRMYRGFGELWRGLSKNATEGFATPRLILPATVLLFGGQVLPFVLLMTAALLPPAALALTIGAVLLAWLPRWLGVYRFRQSPLGAVAHPVGVLVLLMIQWCALCGRQLGRPAVWKGRSYVGSGDATHGDGDAAVRPLDSGTTASDGSDMTREALASSPDRNVRGDKAEFGQGQGG
jgi:hypothetical protein